MVLESKTPIPKNFDIFRKRPFKARTLDVYKDKSQIDYYNFNQHCKDHFAMSRARSLNQLLFAAIFFKQPALFW